MTRSTCSGRPPGRTATGSAAGPRELGGPDETGIAAEHGAHDPRLRTVAAPRELPAEGLTGRADEHLVGRAHSTADDEEAGVEGRGEVGQPDTEPLAEVGDDGRPGLDHGAGLAHERVAAGVLLPAATVAALAARAARHDLHVAELAGDAVPPALDVAVDDEGAADARAERDDDDVRLSPGGTEGRLGPGRGIGVVVDGDRQGDALRQRVTQRLVAPGQVRREDDGRAVLGDEARGADADGHDVVGVDVAEQLLDRLDDGVLDDRRGCRAVGGVTTGAMGDDARLVDDTTRDLRAADVDADRETPAHALPPGPFSSASMSSASALGWASSRSVSPSGAGSARRSRCAVARSRRAVAAKPTKSATFSMVSGSTCWTKAMSWQTGHTRHAAGVVPPHVHSPGDPSGRRAASGPAESPAGEVGPAAWSWPCAAPPARSPLESPDGIRELPDHVRRESRSTSSAASAATLPGGASSGGVEPVGLVGGGGCRVGTVVRCHGRSGLDALLQLLERGVDDDLLRLALEQPDHGDLDVDRQAVGHLRARAVTREGVRAVHGLEDVGRHERPGDDPGAVLDDVPLVVKDVGVLDGAGVERELHLVGPAVALLGEDGDVLHLTRPL